MTILMRRHAPTQGNLARQYVGHLNQPLSQEGLALARAVPPILDVARVYTSHLQRTVQTAGILYPGARIHPMEGLAEMNFGQFEGKSWQDLQHNDEYQQWLDSNCEAPCPGGEEKEAFTKRCCATFWQLTKEEQAHGAQNVHMLVHGGTIMAILGQLAQPPKDYFEWGTGFCEGYLVQLSPAQSHSSRPLQILSQHRNTGTT